MPLAWLVLAPVMVMNLWMLIAVWLRVPEEDEISKETFAKEWDEWANKVPIFQEFIDAVAKRYQRSRV